MGSFIWDNPGCIQYHNGRPLSSALIEPCQCQNEIQPCIQSDFAIQCRPRSQSSGRRYKRESYRIYHPHVQYASFCYPPPYQRQFMDHCGSRDFFAENLNTVVYEEERCRPKCRCVTYVRTPSPIIRQVKIRSRPASCVNLHKDNQWTKVVEERHDEHYDYNYTLPVEHSVPISRSSTRDAATETDIIPRKPIRPLSISETEVHDRYEKEEKIKRDATEVERRTITYTTTAERPLYSSYAVIDHTDGDDDSDEKHYKKSSTKVQRKEFVQRMHAKNGTASKTSNSFNTYSDLGKNQVITRSITSPHEAIVDAASRTSNSFNTYSDLGTNQVITRSIASPREAIVDAASRTSNSFNIYSDLGKNQVITRSVTSPREAIVDADLRTSNSFNIYSDLGRNQVITRSITSPREAIVDAGSIIVPSVETWSSSTPINYESKMTSRNYYQST